MKYNITLSIIEELNTSKETDGTLPSKKTIDLKF